MAVGHPGVTPCSKYVLLEQAGAPCRALLEIGPAVLRLALLSRHTLQLVFAPTAAAPIPPLFVTSRVVDGKKVRYLKKTGEVLPERVPERKAAE